MLVPTMPTVDSQCFKHPKGGLGGPAGTCASLLRLGPRGVCRREGARAGHRSAGRIWSLCSQLKKRQQVAEAAGGGAPSSSDMGCFFLLSEQLPCLATVVK